MYCANLHTTGMIPTIRNSPSQYQYITKHNPPNSSTGIERERRSLLLSLSDQSTKIPIDRTKQPPSLHSQWYGTQPNPHAPPSDLAEKRLPPYRDCTKPDNMPPPSPSNRIIKLRSIRRYVYPALMIIVSATVVGFFYLNYYISVNQILPGSFFDNSPPPQQHTTTTPSSKEIIWNAQKSADEPLLEFVTIPERMNSITLELTPNETKTIPVYGGSNNTELIAGGVCHHQMPNSSNSTTKAESSSSSRCCIGAICGGGAQFHSKRYCHQTMTVYDRVRNLALQELELYPIHKHATPSDDEQTNDWMILKCDVCQIIRSAASLQHKRLSFVGDSIQKQTFIGLECELSRRGFTFSNVRRTTTTTPPFSIEQRAPLNRAAWKYGVKSEECVTVTVPSWILDHDSQQRGRQSISSSQVDICYYSHYRPLLNMEAHRMIAAKSDIMLINYGLHYLPSQKEDKIEFKSTLEALLLEFKTNSTGCILLYRETSAQHFDTHDSEYHRSSSKCIPHTNTTRLQDGWHWRRHILHEAAGSQNFSVVDPYGRMLYDHYTTTEQQVVNQQQQQQQTMMMEDKVIVLPFQNFSSKLYDLHGGGKDCSHFCYTPYMWVPLWRHFRIAMDHIKFQ